MSGGGNSTEAVAGARLLSFIERVERLNEEGAAINKDKAEVFAEAKSVGFDTKAMKVLIRERATDRQVLEEADQILDTYRHAIELASRARGSGDPVGKAGPAVSSRPAEPHQPAAKTFTTETIVVGEFRDGSTISGTIEEVIPQVAAKIGGILAGAPAIISDDNPLGA